MRGPAIQRYDAMVAVRHQPLLPTPTGQTGHPYESAKSIPQQTAMRSVTAAPYARPLPSTTQQMRWRVTMARCWVQGHLIATLLIAIVAVTLVLRPATYPIGMLVLRSATYPIGMLLLGFAVAGIALGAWALDRLHLHQIAQATLLMLLADFLLVAVGAALIGPRMEVCALLPGMLLMAALFADYALVIAGGIIALLGYCSTVVLTQLGIVHPMVLLSADAVVWLDLVLVCLGAGLLLMALGLVMHQLRSALASEAAAIHTVTVLERRAQSKRIAIDADAIALQTQLAQAMHAKDIHMVTTCEDLAPLAQMINAATTRIPGLLRDREERIRLERAIRELGTSLETAWAGFTWQWPAPSGTAVDRLITMLRPSHATTDVTWKQRR